MNSGLQMERGMVGTGKWLVAIQKCPRNSDKFWPPDKEGGGRYSVSRLKGTDLSGQNKLFEKGAGQAQKSPFGQEKRPIVKTAAATRGPHGLPTVGRNLPGDPPRPGKIA